MSLTLAFEGECVPAAGSSPFWSGLGPAIGSDAAVSSESASSEASAVSGRQKSSTLVALVTALLTMAALQLQGHRSRDTQVNLLRDLYVESELWRFEWLLKAIEVKNVQLWQLQLSGSGKAAVQGSKAEGKEKVVKVTRLSTSQKKRRSMSVKAKPKTKTKKSGEDEEMGTWWEDSKYKGTDDMDILAGGKVTAVDGVPKTPRSPLVAYHTWAPSMTLRK
ncbi:uncharacterized protein KRP23_8247 [Phytophthora ramorum]|uniref:uncharacterized protein n=1 Tax=Phytophthora ramorum TaxID=164328 RepID=UPI0030982F6F|nr:hypothetical protein KRP23_8247 [Phytophthora ramorum]